MDLFLVVEVDLYLVVEVDLYQVDQMEDAAVPIHSSQVVLFLVDLVVQLININAKKINC